MSPAAIFRPPLPPGMPNRAPRRCMASARTGAERAEPEPERAVRRRRWRQRAGGRAGCAGDRSRASRGGRGERAAGRERAPGARGGRATLLFLIQWRVSGPAAASGGAGERQPQRAGEGELERGPASGPGSAAGGGGRAPEASAREPERAGCRPRRGRAPGKHHVGVFYPELLACRGATPRRQTQRAGLGVLKTACF